MLPDMRLILDGLDDLQRDQMSLVLSAVGIEHETLRSDEGWEIWVESKLQLAALRALDSYLEENQKSDHPKFAPLNYGWSISAAIVVVMLALFFALLNLSGHQQKAIQFWGASAHLILGGQVDRCLTALFLHANLGHLLGNMLGLMIFGGAAALTWGAAPAWLWIVLSASLGNLVNAILYQSGHMSIGASTAVFSAIGLLSIRAFYLRYNDRRSRMRAWLPLAAGLALFAMIGSSQNADVTAHLFGLLAGMAIGWLVRRQAAKQQVKSTASSSAILLLMFVGSAWTFAIWRYLV